MPALQRSRLRISATDNKVQILQVSMQKISRNRLFELFKVGIRTTRLISLGWLKTNGFLAKKCPFGRSIGYLGRALDKISPIMFAKLLMNCAFKVRAVLLHTKLSPTYKTILQYYQSIWLHVRSTRPRTL
jgi:hypothetical protein